MFGIGMWEGLLIVALVLIFFGPSRLPGLGKSLGEGIREFKKGIAGEENKNVEKNTDKKQISSNPSDKEHKA